MFALARRMTLGIAAASIALLLNTESANSNAPPIPGVTIKIQFHHKTKGWESPEGNFDNEKEARDWANQIIREPSSYDRYSLIKTVKSSSRNDPRRPVNNLGRAKGTLIIREKSGKKQDLSVESGDEAALREYQDFARTISGFEVGMKGANSASGSGQTPAPKTTRPYAPVGYLVTYMSRDGKLLSDGKQYRIAIVTKNFRDAKKQFDNLNSIHMYRAFWKELKTETEFRGALLLQQDPKTGLPRKQEPGMANGQVGGMKYRIDGREFTFQKNGSVITSAGTSGSWKQNGKAVTWTINDVFEFRYSGTLSASGETMTVTRSIYNPRTGNEGQRSSLGTGKRIP